MQLARSTFSASEVMQISAKVAERGMHGEEVGYGSFAPSGGEDVAARGGSSRQGKVAFNDSVFSYSAPTPSTAATPGRPGKHGRALGSASTPFHRKSDLSRGEDGLPEEKGISSMEGQDELEGDMDTNMPLEGSSGSDGLKQLDSLRWLFAEPSHRLEAVRQSCLYALAMVREGKFSAVEALLYKILPSDHEQQGAILLQQQADTLSMQQADIAERMEEHASLLAEAGDVDEGPGGRLYVLILFN